MACFADDRDALLAIHRVPVRHRIRVRTTNLAGRSFEEERRRTKVIPRLMSEKATMKLVFATMTPRRRALVPGVDQRPRAPPAQTPPRRARPRPTTSRRSANPSQEIEASASRHEPGPDLQDAQDLGLRRVDSPVAGGSNISLDDLHR